MAHLLKATSSCSATRQLSRYFSNPVRSHIQHAAPTATESSVITEAFHYTSGRWLYNQSIRLRERNFSFNIPALVETGAQAIGRTTSDVQSFRKLAEGGFNRVFEVTMRDGFQLIARMPYPVTQPKRLTTASEVATMDLVRGHGVPVPKVFQYSADDNNPIGAEYILMEKVHGKPLSDVWFTMSDKERLKVLSGIVDIEAKLFDIDLPANGSIFYVKDFPQTMQQLPLLTPAPSEEALCIGPDVSLKFWFQERSELDIQRKPFITAKEVLEGAATKERAWLQTYGRPRMPFDRMYRDITDFQKSDPEEHLRSLENYMKIAPYLAPKEPWLCKPTLRHPDLTPNNVFVSDELEIVGIIDWQHTKALPLFLNVGYPSHFQNYGDPESEDLVKPQLPQDLDQLDDEEREQELEQYRRRYVHFYYAGATATKNKRHFDAMMHEGGLFRRRIYEHAAEPWEGNNIPLKADLIRLSREWLQLAQTQEDLPPACPFVFEDEEDAEKVLQGALKQEEVDQQLDMLRNDVGVGIDGWVSIDKYDTARDRSAYLKARAFERADDDFERWTIEKFWPFDDFDEKE